MEVCYSITKEKKMAQKIIISIPTDDLQQAYEFYLKGLGFKLAREMPDGSRPEPVVFQIADGAQMMLVPRDGFAALVVTPAHKSAESNQSEYVLSQVLESAKAVDSFMDKAVQAGATTVTQPEQLPWGYIGRFKDLDGHMWMGIYEG
jgi:hypothetical protein